MDDGELQRFSEGLGPPDEFIEKVKLLMEEKLFNKLRKESKYCNIDRCVLTGGLGKKTSTKIKCDADVAIFYNGSTKDKKKILNDFQDILMLSTKLDEKDIKITPHATLQFEMDGIGFDVVTAKNYARTNERSKVKSQRINSLQQLKNSKKEWELPDKTWVISDTTESSLEFMKNKSKFVHDVVRLSKYWNQLMFYGGYIYGRSLIVELLATKSALEEEDYNKGAAIRGKGPSIKNAFQMFLKKAQYLSKIEVVFEDYYKRSEIPHEIIRDRPFLMDPVNPYNNLLDRKRVKDIDKFFDTFAKYATTTLRMLENGCPNLGEIFFPQPLLYMLPRNKKMFIPKRNSYLISTENGRDDMDPNLIGMPKATIRDPKGNDIKLHLESFLHMIAGHVHNQIKAGEEKSSREIKKIS